jgi:hypothetical protein
MRKKYGSNQSWLFWPMHYLNFKKRYFKILRKNMLKNLINHCFFGTWPTNFVATFRKKNVKISTNHGYFGP